MQGTMYKGARMTAGLGSPTYKRASRCSLVAKCPQGRSTRAHQRYSDPAIASLYCRWIMCGIAAKGRGKLKAMVRDKLSATIARSLTQLADKTGKLADFKKELDVVTESITDDVRKFFANPTITKQQKMKFMEDVAKQASLSKEMTAFLAFLVDGKHVKLLGEIREAFERSYQEKTSTKTVYVTSAAELTDDQQFKLAKKLQSLTKSKNVVLSPKVDPSLEGGFVVEFDSFTLDLSVKGNFRKIVRGMQQQMDLEYGKMPKYVPGGHMDPYATGEYARQRDAEEQKRWEAAQAKEEAAATSA